ncbi:MAG TPA: TIM-barrel domain-containing protein [Terriglobales bacterium]|nr:TIM-barrel domain-containing protein [Terriglobales bacterium]
MSSFQYINVQNFTPNLGQWTMLANVTGPGQSGNSFQLQMSAGPGPVITFLSNSAFRVRFNPAPGANLSNDISYAVVNRNLGPVTLNVTQSASAIEIDTSVIRVVINKTPYGISVYRGNQLIHSDTPTYNLVYIPGQEVIANFKVYPANARYVGFGEKAGAQLLKNQFTMTFFNWDNFTYLEGGIPANTSGGPLNPSEPLYCSVPFLIETNPNPLNGSPYSYGIFLDNTAQSYINIGTDDYSNMFGKYYFGALYGDLDYYFMYGDGVGDVINLYTSLTGRPALPPRYVFGFHQGCYGYYDENILLQKATTYRNSSIPIDGLHIDVDFQDNYRTFTSSNKKFPDAASIFATLHQQGFKLSTNITPLVTSNPLDENGNPNTPYPARDSGLALNTPGQAPGAFIYDTRGGGGPNPNRFIGNVGYGNNNNFNPFNSDKLGSYGYYPDFGRPDVQQWWGQQYAYLVQTLGLDMIWQDMTCPAITNGDASTFPLDLMVDFFGQYTEVAKIHNSYVLNLLKATFEGLAALRPNQRNFIIARGGFAGMQRYAALWTGDSASDWDFLQINVPEVLNLGLSGIPISGCDIGGFANGLPENMPNGTTAPPVYPSQLGGPVLQGITNYELLTRWMILGSFLPWYRNHYDGYTKQFQEPWAYGEPVPTNCSYFVGLRYRMLHVYYSAMYEATQTGMPIARALFLNDPNDLAVYSHLDDQFFVGHDILMAPILNQCESASPPIPPQRDVYLPSTSDWYAFTDNLQPLGAQVAGGTTVTNWYGSLNNQLPYLMPIYIRAGAIIPMRELEHYVGQLPQNPITFNVYPGPDSSFELYQDDGISNLYKTGSFRTTTISHQEIQNGQSVRVLRTHDQYAPPEPFYFVSFLGTNPPTSVTCGGAALPNVFTPAALWSASANSYYYNQSIKATFLKIFDVAPDVTLEVTF